MGIFGGVKDLFTGGGGAPEFQGMNRSQRNAMMNYQLHNQQRATDRMNQNDLQTDWRAGVQRASMPWMFSQMGLAPQYDAQGNLVGYSDMPGATSEYAQGRTPQMSSTGEYFATHQANNDARMQPWVMQQMGYNPQYDESGNLTGITGEDRFASQIDQERQMMNQGMQDQLGGLEASRQYSVGSYDPAMQSAQRNMTFEEGQINPQLQRLGMQYGGNGQYVNDPNSPEAQSRNMQSLFLNRANDAMAGRTQQDPTLVRQLKQEEDALRSQLQASLGPDYATSTPGMAALADFAKRRAEAYYGDTQNQMNQGVQNANSLGAYGLSTMDRLFNVGRGMRDATGQYGNLAQARGNTDLGYQGQLMSGREAMGTQNLAYMNAGNNVRNTNMGNIFGAAANARASQAAMQPWAAMAENRPMNQQALRSQRMSDLYSGLNFATRDPGYLQSAALSAQIGSNSTALPWASADWQGKVTNDATNMNNMFWRNMAASAGSSIGSMAGGWGGSMMGGGGGTPPQGGSWGNVRFS